MPHPIVLWTCLRITYVLLLLLPLLLLLLLLLLRCVCSIPQVLMDDVLHPPAGGPALSLYVSGTNTIFLFVAVCVAYGMVSDCLP